MTALQRKLLRDLVTLGPQVVTIAAVIGCGIAGYVAMRGAWKSLETSREVYYQRYRFGDVFAHLSRAPDAEAARLAEIEGVAVVETRLVEPIRLPMPGLLDPARGWVVSLPSDRPPRLDDIWLRRGRMFEPGAEEAVVLSSFADAHDLQPGDVLQVVMNGQLQRIRMVGVADSPEFTFATAPGEMLPDPARFAVLWMDEDVIAPLWQMEGAFDDVVLRLQPGTEPRPVLDAVDRVIERWGGEGAVARADQTSHRLLEQEMGQLRILATTIPVVFLGVAAFLLQVVLSRIVQLQRTQIATLKAFGYTRTEIGLHYLGMVSAVGVLGTGIGLGLGAWLGIELTALYAGVFNLPAFAFRLDPELVSVSLVVSVGAAVVGGLGTVRRVVAMPPAEAMQPPAPPSYGGSWLDRAVAVAILGPAARMMLRDLLRRPGRLALSITGLAFATAVVVLGRFSEDAVDLMGELMFAHVQADDISLSFADPVPRDDLRTLAHLPGVRYVEGQRLEPARFSSGHVRRDGVLIGYPLQPKLRRLIEFPLHVVTIPEHGIVLTDLLAEILDLEPGDPVRIEMLFGTHETGTLPLVGVVDEPLGLQGHVSLDTLARFLGEPVRVNAAYLAVDPEQEPEVMRRLVDVPGVLGATRKVSMRRRFEEQTAESRGVFTLIASAFGSAMAIGVVYNNARIALAARAREYASLRVLGFTRGEVTLVVLGEQAVQLAVGIPLGLVLGRWLAIALMSTADPETWRFPIFIAARTYAFATLVVLGAAVICGWIVRRQVARLDLISVLKTRE